MTSRRKSLFAAALILFNLGAFVVALKGYRYYKRRIIYSMSRSGWEAGYTERNLPLPPKGPRDGYWGSRMGANVVHPVLGWIAPPVRFPGELEIDDHGLQYVPGPRQDLPRMLIVGASTAFGGYASNIEKTYFGQLSSLLAQRGHPVSITVCATGAWKSDQELKASRLIGVPLRPDIVLYLDGLNDLTNGSNARTWFGVPTKTLDGSKWNLFYHEHDYQARVDFYLQNMQAARDMWREQGAEVVFALQPASFEKKVHSAVEQQVERWSLAPHASRQALLDSYQSMRERLARLAQAPGVHFIDASRVFDAETATTFTDFWHFSDPGHAILGRYLAEQLATVIPQPRRPTVEQVRAR